MHEYTGHTVHTCTCTILFIHALNSIEGLALYSGDIMTTSSNCTDRIPAVQALNIRHCGIVTMETERPTRRGVIHI